jgi:hypothetical protein
LSKEFNIQKCIEASLHIIYPTMPTDALLMMVRARDTLKSVEPRDRDGFYRDVLIRINSYIAMYCTHEYIDDTIDIDPERSQNISYCKHCYQNK